MMMINRGSTLNARVVIPSAARNLGSGAPRSRSLAWRLGMTISLFAAFTPLKAQEMIHVRDLTIEDKAIPVRLMGYGLVIGLDGTGDKASGGKLGGMTVNSVVNLLKRFKVEIPLEAMKTKNVAAVLVTAEVSPYLRAGGRFQVHVSSLGDARSLRGGVLWMTPLQADISADPVATAQGPVLMADMGGKTGVENSSRIPQGGLLEIELPRPQFAQSNKLLLREPDVTMATRIANAINKEIGDGAAEVEDPGSIKLSFKGNKDGVALTLARIQDLRVQPQRVARLIIDSRDGTIIAGGDLTVGEATVSHGGITLTVGSATDTTAAPAGSLKMPSGTPVTRIASALHAVQAPPAEVAAIFESLRAIGAIAAEVIVR